ncbi:MAG: hypothetical protein QXR45_10005 [Candidatus Bathyarchaeia archaeon]
MPFIFRYPSKMAKRASKTTYEAFAKATARLAPKGICVLNEQDELSLKVSEILGLIADANAILLLPICHQKSWKF